MQRSNATYDRQRPSLPAERKALLERLIETKKHFLDEFLDKTLAHYEKHGDRA